MPCYVRYVANLIPRQDHRPAETSVPDIDVCPTFLLTALEPSNMNPLHPLAT